ncbi:MAG TPA: IS200/IS605 family transposase, partial [Terriglobales bacterium]|nr:IS200/IS605 family transposase [Terriglobales bacterium]
FHCIFATKERQDRIPAELRTKLWAYLIGTAKNFGIVPVAVGGTANHAHLLLSLKPTMRISEAVQKLKANSSRWMGEQGIDFEWQKGYAVLSVSPSQTASVRAYVLNQEKHHRTRTFEEVSVVLQKAGVVREDHDFN